MTTINLPFKRWVAQVYTGAPRSKSSYLSMMAENLEALMACPWRAAADVPATLTGHDFTAASYLSDAFDAYKMTGNYNSNSMTEVGYAGMAAYRFKIPSSAIAAPAAGALVSVALPVSRDRFCRSGVRVAVELTDRATPSTDWATVRGTDETSATTLAQSAAYLLAGSPGADTVTIAVPSGSGNPAAYLWVYVSLADYTDHWTMYSPTEQRLYAIEGSAMLAGPAAAVTFAGEVTPDGDGVVLLEGGSSPTWLQPLPTQNVGTTPPPVPSTPVVETFYTDAQAVRTSQSYTKRTSLGTPRVSGQLVIEMLGTSVQAVSWGGYPLTATGASRQYWERSGPYSGGTLRVNVNCYARFVAEGSDYARLSWNATINFTNEYGHTSDGSSTSQEDSDYNVYRAYVTSTTYLMVALTDGVPTDADVCDSPSESGRRHETAEITGDSSPWTIVLANVEYTVGIADQVVTLSRGGTILGTWTSVYSPSGVFFDASVALRLGNQAVENYGLAPVASDFSAAVATFEMGTQPSEAEMLGRLVRLSRGQAGSMSYLHPASGALASEIDVLRPVPRFYRAATAPSQTTCQPGLSVWYRRPAAGSSATRGLAYDGGVVGTVVVSAPVFLQYALLALRAPAAFAMGLRISNVGESAVANAFALRFVAWRTAAADWDGSDAWGLAAMAAMPSVYRSDGPATVAWSADLTGGLMPLGSRQVSADRIGVSPVISGAIAAGAVIDIPIIAPVAAGDVVLVAPEVVGFADGGAAASATFGRQADPAGTDAEAHSFAWARYPENLGWFPRVVGY